MASKTKQAGRPLSRDNGQLPKGWKMVRFGDVVQDVKESEKNPLDAGLERYVGLEHIEPENLHLRQWGDLTQDEVSFTKRFRKGQVLFGKRRAYQRKVAVAEFDGICSSDILTFEPRGNDLLPELLPFIVQSDQFFDHALDTSSGSLSPRTRWAQLKEFQLPLPTQDVQRQLSEMLQAADDSIGQTRGLVETLEKQKKILAAHLWRNGIRHKKFQESPIGIVPSEWNIASFREVVADWAHGPRFPADDYCKDGNVQTVRTTDFNRRGAVDLSSAPAASLAKDVIEKHRLLSGDFLFSRSGQYSGLTATFPESDRCCIAAAFLIRFRLRPVMCSEFLVELFYSDFGDRFVMPLRRGTYQKNISGSAILDLKIPVPPIEEQRQMCAILAAAEDTIRKAKSHVTTSVELVRGLSTAFLDGTIYAGNRR